MKKVICCLMVVILVAGFSACKTGTAKTDIQSTHMTEIDIINSSDETNIIATQQDIQNNPVTSLTKLPVVTQYSDRLDDALKIRRTMLNADEKRLYDKFLPYVLSYTSFTIDYKDMDYDLETLQNALYAIRLDYPETWMYFASGSDIDASLKNDDGDYGRFVSYSSTYFSLKWTEEGIKGFDKNFVSDYISQIDQKCDLILEQMPKGLSDKEKYIWLADYVCAITEYYDDPNGNYIYADGPFLYGKGICQSYSYAYQWLCQKAGLWCITCSGMSGGAGHCWNVVKLEDQKTYYMDLTWADSANNPHNFYFMSYDKCTQFHTIDQGEWIADGNDNISKAVMTVRIKKYVSIPIIIILCVIAYAVFAKPAIAKHTWVLSYAQQTEPPHFVVAHNDDYDFSNDDSSLFEFSKPIELTLEAKDGKLILTDTTNGKTYEGTYKVKSWNRFTNQRYSVLIDGVEGTANITSRFGGQLFVSIGNYDLCFAVK